MQTISAIRHGMAVAAILFAASRVLAAQAAQTPVVLDRVVAVANGRAILASEVEEEMRLSILEPSSNERQASPRRALQELISRTVIQQQLKQENPQGLAPSDKDLSERMDELRRNLPACVRMNCITDSGWAAFLAKSGLTQAQVIGYLKMRLEILNFIEERFRQGIHISREEIETYYKETLLPQYPANEPAPALDTVAPRIEEILRQQQVNVLFDQWLDNLRQQGDVEILDPALESTRRRRSRADGGSEP